MMALLTREEVHARLQVIFPDGSPNRAYLTRMLAASTVFVALYIDAIEGNGTYLGPKHVYRMTNEQAAQIDDASRAAYSAGVLRTGTQIEGRRWYQDNTREPIRDETLREGLVAIGAVTERTDLATTSSKPRYALKASFAALFDPALTGEALQARITAWQAEALNKGALARLAIVRRGAGVSTDQVLVTFPNGETRRMKPGPSSEITRAVMEVFAPTFLTDPAVVFLSESGNKVVARDDELARSIGLAIQADKNLPDTILVDLGPAHPLLVFVEVVATDGPISQRRKEALEELVAEAGFPAEHVAFVTAYLDRSAGPFKKTVDSLAWGSYAWFAAEPERLVVFSEAHRGLNGRP
ncbi:BsuBI/PstI restriction endonuclease C-terminus [Sphingomonas gellani]|uniref:BsuBI/PstI restriction endonuclease C-terminus n=1 Tax=Sphingomonas gellani TaxID=1166340 RepID=A0A1H8IML7_9SPHN|nr:BsuBI/PstI family type II restriction endonuclease [Sphingomonas gellani]SEN70180.1 BsuBI/PstI restriction endonuclease C-terminus [Sphingomonas gellani]